IRRVFLQTNFIEGSASAMSVTYSAVLPVRDEIVGFVAGLLAAERLRRGTGAKTRSLSVHDQAVLVLRWFLDGTRLKQLARDNASASLPFGARDVVQARRHGASHYLQSTSLALNCDCETIRGAVDTFAGRGKPATHGSIIQSGDLAGARRQRDAASQAARV